MELLEKQLFNPNFERPYQRSFGHPFPPPLLTYQTCFMSNATITCRKGLLLFIFLLSITHSLNAQVTNTVTFNTPIAIAPNANTANLYPANLSVSGQQALVSKVVVTLTSLQLSIEYTFDVYLQSPSGKTINLFGRHGNSGSFSGNLVFDQSSSNTLPPLYSADFTPGTYQPSLGIGVTLPPGSTGNLDDLNGTAANGTWKLYAYNVVARSDIFLSLASWSLTITSIPVISNNSITAPATSSFCASGNPANIVGSTPTGGDGTYTYKWQSSTNNNLFTDVATTASYNPGSLSQTTYYRRIVNSDVASDTSSTVTITIQPALGNNTLTAPATSTFYTSTGNAAAITGSTPTGGNGTYNYQWQNSTNNISFTDIGLATGKNYDPPSISTTTYYRRLVTSGACTIDDISDTVAIFILYTQWTGATNTDWNTPTNWTNGVPAAGYKVLIPPYANSPILNSVASIKDLDLGNTSLTLNANLSVTGNITCDGDYISGTGALELTGNAQTFTGFSINIDNLVLNSTGTVTLNTGVHILKTLTPLDGVLVTNGGLVLESSATATARIAAGSSSGGYISGNVSVERYIPGGFRKYRFLGHPFSTAMPLTWLTSALDITGVITGSNANNFTTTAANSPSAFSFDESLDDGLTGANNNAGWQAYASGNSASSIAAGQGIRVLVRGSKGQAGSLTGGTYTPNAVTFSMMGAVKQGNFTQNLSFTSAGKGWNLISNPYPSNIDWTAVSRTNVGAAVYAYRPSLSAGTYASYNNGSSTNGGSRYLEMGSAFFIRATAASPSLGWQETDKVANDPANSVFRTQNNIHNRSSLVLTNEQTNSTDEVVVRFGDDPATDVFDNEYDAYNLPGSAQDLYVQDMLQNRYSIYHGSELKIASIEKRAVALGMDNLVAGNYSITARTLNAFVNSNTAYLKDALLDTLTEIADSCNYQFSIANNQQSITNRFSIVFNAKEKPVLAMVQTVVIITVSPNPAKDLISIHYEGLDKREATSIRIVDMNGKLLKTIHAGTVDAGQQSVNVKGWASGVYSIQLVNGNHRQTQTIIKQ